MMMTLVILYPLLRETQSEQLNLNHKAQLYQTGSHSWSLTQAMAAGGDRDTTLEMSPAVQSQDQFYRPRGWDACICIWIEKFRVCSTGGHGNIYRYPPWAKTFGAKMRAPYLLKNHSPYHSSGWKEAPAFSRAQPPSGWTCCGKLHSRASLNDLQPCPGCLPSASPLIMDCICGCFILHIWFLSPPDHSRNNFVPPWGNSRSEKWSGVSGQDCADFCQGLGRDLEGAAERPDATCAAAHWSQGNSDDFTRMENLKDTSQAVFRKTCSLYIVF